MAKSSVVQPDMCDTMTFKIAKWTFTLGELEVSDELNWSGNIHQCMEHHLNEIVYFYVCIVSKELKTVIVIEKYGTSKPMESLS